MSPPRFRFHPSALLAALLGGLSLVPAQADPLTTAVHTLERQLPARIGYAIQDTSDGRRWLYRADERFAMASTSKVLMCATLLQQGPEALSRAVTIGREDILSYAPTLQHHIGQSLTADRLCATTLRNSDNSAANGVLKVIGGPPAVTAFVRAVGDPTTRLDRDEPTLNEARPGDPRDTTTPRAMMETLHALVLGSALPPSARAQLTQWMEDNEVGGPLLRSGIPADWRIADKTGAGGFGTRGIVAVLWPTGRAPVVAAFYLTETDASMADRNAAIATLGRALVQALDASP